MSAERLTQAMAEQVHRFAQALGRARRGEVTGVHQARVASRRIREILPLVETLEMAGEDGAIRQRRRGKDVRRVTTALGAVREIDVTLGLLSAASVRYQWPSAVVAAVAAKLDADRLDRLDDLIEALQRVGPRDLLRDLRRLAVMQSTDSAALHTAMQTRRKLRGAALSATLRALGTLYVPDRLHAVRLASKKLRYSLETQRALRRGAVANDIRKLTSIQEELGELHDLQILQERLHAAPREAHRAELRHMEAEIERECRASHARILAKVPAWLKMSDRIAES